MKYLLLVPLCGLALLAGCQSKEQTGSPIKVLLIEGQNNHKNWPETSQFMKQTLESSGLFEVTITRTPPSDGRKQNFAASQPHTTDMAEELQEAWANWKPDFSQFDAVISNYNGVFWPEEVRLDFVDFVHSGGGFVSIHAADNAFTDWVEYQKMIGVGGWYGRNAKTHGPKIVWENNGLALDHSAGKCGAHGARQPVLIENRNQNHPITKGLPDKWMHPTDEVYYNMCGPAQNITVLASAFSDPNTKGSGKDHPILLTLPYGNGRVFHNMLGHSNEAFSGAGFQHLLIRGTEWVATGKVTSAPPDPADFSAKTIVTSTP